MLVVRREDQWVDWKVVSKAAWLVASSVDGLAEMSAVRRVAYLVVMSDG